MLSLMQPCILAACVLVACMIVWVGCGFRVLVSGQAVEEPSPYVGVFAISATSPHLMARPFVIFFVMV